MLSRLSLPAVCVFVRCGDWQTLCVCEFVYFTWTVGGEQTPAVCVCVFVYFTWTVGGEQTPAVCVCVFVFVQGCGC